MVIPAILLAIALMALTKASLENVIIAITIAEVPRVARLVRGVVLSLREQPFVEAVVVTGSYNFTKAAQEKNAENVVVISGSPEVALRFARDFERHRDRSSRLQ